MPLTPSIEWKFTAALWQSPASGYFPLLAINTLRQAISLCLLSTLFISNKIMHIQRSNVSIFRWQIFYGGTQLCPTFWPLISWNSILKQKKNFPHGSSVCQQCGFVAFTWMIKFFGVERCCRGCLCRLHYAQPESARCRVIELVFWALWHWQVVTDKWQVVGGDEVMNLELPRQLDKFVCRCRKNSKKKKKKKIHCRLHAEYLLTKSWKLYTYFFQHTRQRQTAELETPLQPLTIFRVQTLHTVTGINHGST